MRTWTHLERQRGGFGFLGGPGEAQIELDRRMIEERIDAIRKRARGRRAHARAAPPGPPQACRIRSSPSSATPTPASRRCSTASPAPRSSPSDQVFATLDPTMREVTLEERPAHHPVRHRRLHLRPADHAGRRLPRHARGGDRGRPHPARARHRARRDRRQARDVEARAGRSRHRHASPPTAHILEVWNKIDLLEPGDARGGGERRALAGAPAGARLGGDRARGSRRCSPPSTSAWDAATLFSSSSFPAHEGRLLNWLYEEAEVQAREALDSGEVRVARARCGREERTPDRTRPPRRCRAICALPGGLTS